MAEEKEEWSEVDTKAPIKEEKVEYEVEGEENEKVETPSPVKETKKESKVEKEEVIKEEQTPEELEGIETKGAQKSRYKN